MKFASLIGRLAIAAAALASAVPAVAQWTTLAPGAFREIDQNLTVNVVFVNLPAGGGVTGIDEGTFRAALPATYRPIHRYPNFYGNKQSTGNRFAFNYNVVQAPASYADALFGYLGSIATPQPRTLFQNEYNAQPGNLDVTQNHWIDAAAAEAWLAANPPAGVDTSTYTVYYINWYGRGDFRFHVYTRLDNPDPDTGYNFGLLRSSRKIVAWGGTPPAGSNPAKRVWFYDVSAGPESWTGQFDIVNADYDGDGTPDYRIPAIWDYGNPNGYRAFDNLSGDLAKLTRYVAINLLFTTSPLYKPAISAPVLPGKVNVDINLFQGDVTSDANAFIKPAQVSGALGRLQRHNQFTADTRSYAFDGRLQNVLGCFTFGPSCYGNRLFGSPFGDLFLYHGDHLLQYLDGDKDYEVPVFAYNLPDSLAGGLLGFADDNWRDGTQSYVFEFLAPSLRAAGYGFTTTTTHEVGHHVGMSHPHDGYDSEQDLDYGASGPYYFAWAGDESATIMHYLDLSREFSQFDRDNMDRWMTAAYINQANVVLASIVTSPRAGRAGAALASADADATAALAAYAGMNYGGAVAKAKSAYAKVLGAAASIGVKVEPQAWQADYKSKGTSPKFVDRVDYLHRLAP